MCPDWEYISADMFRCLACISMKFCWAIRLCCGDIIPWCTIPCCGGIPVLPIMGTCPGWHIDMLRARCVPCCPARPMPGRGGGCSDIMFCKFIRCRLEGCDLGVWPPPLGKYCKVLLGFSDGIILDRSNSGMPVGVGRMTSLRSASFKTEETPGCKEE